MKESLRLEGVFRAIKLRFEPGLNLGYSRSIIILVVIAILNIIIVIIIIIGVV